MANGFCPYLLQDIGAITGNANPMYKIQPNGFTGMLLTAGTPAAIQNAPGNGHFKTVQVKYMKRATVAQTDTSLSCDQTQINSYNEATVSVANIRQYSFHVEDETMAAYCDPTTTRVSAGSLPGGVLSEVLSQIFSGANAILHGVNQDVLGLLTWGKNKVTGNNAATTMNISKDLTVQSLTAGVTQLLADYKKNYLTSRPQIVGQGIFINYVLQAAYSTPNIYGFDTKMALGNFDFWNDSDFDSTIGTNQIGVFEPNSIQLVSYLKYTGFKSGTFGTDTFGTITLPMYMADEVVPVSFDIQVRYHPCATEVTNAYTGQALSIEKGWQVILSKNFGLFQLPTDSYRAEDQAHGINGALRYSVTNTCETC